MCGGEKEHTTNLLKTYHTSLQTLPIHDSYAHVQSSRRARVQASTIHFWLLLIDPEVTCAGGLCIPNIQANELSFDGDVSTGKIIRNVETGLDKDRHFVQILDTLKKFPEELAENVVEDVRSVYIGDSLTDLLCLLRADVGIVLGDSSTLRQVYGRGLSPLYLKALHEAQAKMKGDKKLGNSSGLVYMVSSWYEVEAFLLGPASSNLGTM